MYWVFASPEHVLPQELESPTDVDPIGVGHQQRRRRWPRPTGRWQLNIPGPLETLDPLWGLFEYMQGDTSILFDGAGFAEIVTPEFYGLGDGQKRTFDLLHYNVLVASIIAYMNGAVHTGWIPSGGDGITCNKIQHSAPPPANAILTIKYRRLVKVVMDTEQRAKRERQFHDLNDITKSVFRINNILIEVPT